MDLRTTCRLCLADLVLLIEAGDFRAFRSAEGLINDALASVPTDLHRGALLHRLGDELRQLRSDSAHSDAVVRAMQAYVRRQQERYFRRRLLTGRATKARIAR